MTSQAKRSRSANPAARLALAALLAVSTASWSAGGPGPGAARPETVSQAGQLPPIPKDAEEAYFRALDLIEMLNKRPNQAAGSAEWDSVIKRLMEARREAPKAPQILRDLGLAHQLRGRASAAVAWFKAAYHAIKDIDPNAALLGELDKRIQRLRQVPQDQIELALTFAAKEIPYLHAKKMPDLGGRAELFPPSAAPPVAPMVVPLSGDQGALNPELFNKDGSPKVQDVPAYLLERALIEFRLASGDASAIPDAEEHYRLQERSSDITSWSYVRLNAYKLCLKALTDAQSWPQVAQLAEEAAEWCRQIQTAWTAGQEARFDEARETAAEIVRSGDADKAIRWLELAEELSGSDDEVYFQAKIDALHQTTERGEKLLEGITRAVRPIAHNLMRLRSIAD